MRGSPALPSAVGAVVASPGVVMFLGLAGCGSVSLPAEPSSATVAEVASADGQTVFGEAPPTGPLPVGVAPSHYALDLQIDPTENSFSGTAQIRVDLTTPRRVIWLHGRDLMVQSVTVRPADGAAMNAEWRSMDEEGVAALVLPEEIGPGTATIEIAYGAAFDRQLKGLYRVDSGGESYAFTQFEAISARLAFPCFDEPRFKTPYDVSITSRAGHRAFANTHIVAEETLEDGRLRSTFATTERLPTYLVAFAVGNLDVVEAPPIPANSVRTVPLALRGLAAHGQGERLRYALEHTPGILAELEAYFGIAYPYDKLDIVAVPDFASGAMENAGFVTFREWLLLLDGDQAPEYQKRAFAYVMAHELAHQWFGNLVTMPWWDDIWLNEAFATWMGNRVVRARYPQYRAEVSMLDSVHGAMASDSLITARQIRQPIESNHDIRNAFDSITYSKGGGVLEMFERWLGEDSFQQGMRLYMQRHRWGTATADDLLAALGEVSGRDVATPFRTFLFQPGVPLLETELSCEAGATKLSLRQSRYLPTGSAGDRAQQWQIPFCVRYGVGNETKEACELLATTEGELLLEAERCPAWVMPNADGAGYFRFAMPAEELTRLTTTGWRHLSARDRLAIADSVSAAVDSGAIAVADALGSMDVLGRDENRAVATSPMALLAFARDHLVPETRRRDVEARGRRLYQAAYMRLGWGRPGASEDGERKLFRSELIGFLSFSARDEDVRREAARRGRAYLGYGDDDELHPDAVDPTLADMAVAVAVQEGDAAFFAAVEAKFAASQDSTLRGRLLNAMGMTHDPELASRARALALDPRVRVNEVLTTIDRQMRMPETRAQTWAWIKENFAALVERIATTRGGSTPWLASRFCSVAEAEDVEAFYAPRIAALPGGPRNLAGTLEEIHLCAARVEAQRESAQAFFSVEQ